MKRNFKRILLKVSGEALGGEAGFGIDPDTVSELVEEIAEIRESGKEIAIVMGAGNFFRGAKGEKKGIDRVTGDQMGMLATVMNALALRDAFDDIEIKSEVLSAIDVGPIAKRYSPRAAVKLIKKGGIPLCAGGTGNPFFTTDTTAVLRALELKCDVLFKASNVDGIYDSDPKTNPNASRYESLTYGDYLDQKLKAMDLSAVTLAQEHGLNIIFFAMYERGLLKRIAQGDTNLGTLVHAG